MSKDIIANIQNQLANTEYGLDEDTKAIAGSGVGANKRISIKGGVFRKMAGGKEVGAIEDRHMNVIFVKMSHNPSRTYYTGAFKEGEKVSPACWSSDSKVPDPEVKNPQASACDKCQFSVKGSGQGGMGAACRLSWRTAVVLPNDPGGDVMQLVLPATSTFGEEDNGRWPFRAYVKMLANHNISAGRVVTKMQFDTKATAPRVLFSPVSGVPADIIDVLAVQAKKPAAENAVKLSVYQQDEGNSAAAPSAPAIVEPVVASKPKKPTQAGATDVADVLKEWTKK
jgi:hypothetical protein